MVNSQGHQQDIAPLADQNEEADHDMESIQCMDNMNDNLLHNNTVLVLQFSTKEECIEAFKGKSQPKQDVGRELTHLTMSDPVAVQVNGVG